MAQAVAVGAQVPRLGDQLDAAEQRVLRHGGEKSAVAGERGGEVEAEAVDVHLASPITERVQGQLQGAWMGEFEGVAAAAEVFVALRVVGVQAVVAGVVDAAEAEGRPELVGFGGVVEDHVEDDLEAGGVQAADHAAEFVARRIFGLAGRAVRAVRAGRVAWLEGEEGERVVAPVIAEAAVYQAFLVEKGVDRQQFERGDPERAVMLEHGRAGEPGVGAAQRLGNARVEARGALYMNFVEQGVGPRGPRRAVVAPVEGVVIDHARVQAGYGGVVSVGEDAVDFACVGVEQAAARIETMTITHGAVHPVGVAQSCAGAGQKAVPHLVGAGRKVEALLAVIVEQAQLDARGVRRKEREVDAARFDVRAERPGAAAAQRRCGG